MRARAAALILLLLTACAGEAARAPAPEPESESEPGPGWRALSDGGRLTGLLAPETGPVEIGVFQTWIVELRERNGAPVTGADVALAGGMPGHGHGLPTQPRVTEDLGGGRYRIEGVKLNMVGAWVIEVFVQSSAGRDRLRFDLAIDY
jgi:YtkA-like protein